MTSSNDYLAKAEIRQQIDQLHQLGNDCKDELQYAKAEKFYQRAAELAESIHDLSLMIKERFWLADMQRMQGNNRSALTVYAWLIEVAYDPDLDHELTEDDLWIIAGGFMDFVEAGRFLPDMKAADLERVIDRGLDWLSGIGKKNWSAGLRLLRGQLWQSQDRHEAAQAELETALALKRRHPNAPGYTLGTHLLRLADLLQEMDKGSEAEIYYREVIDGHEFNNHNKLWAWKGLAQIMIAREDLAEANDCAQKSLELAQLIEAPTPSQVAYSILATIARKQGQITQAIQYQIQTWHYARQRQSEEALYDVYLEIVELRIAQAQQSDPQRMIRKARQWLRWARHYAVRVDRQRGITKCQDKIRKLEAKCEAVLLPEDPDPDL